MKVKPGFFEDQYYSCLMEYLKGKEESALACVYEIGRLANIKDVGMLELFSAHQTALDKAIREVKKRGEILNITRIANRLLAESLASFEMTNRGFKESLSKLVDTNRLLEREIIDRKQAEKDLGQSVERLKILSEANSLLLASEDPEKVVQTIATKTMLHLNCDCFFNYIDDERAGKLRLNAYTGISEETAKGIEWLDYGVAICGCAARDSCRIISENIQENGDMRAAMVRSFGVQAYACHPLTVGSKTIGTLSFGTRLRTNFTEDELEMMRTIAGQVSVAIERKKVEEALRESEKEYRSLAENIPDIVTRFDKDLRLIFVNNAASQAGGIPPDASVGKNNLELGMNPEQVELWMEHVRHVFATGKAETMEFEWTAPGGLRYQQTIVTPEFDSDGLVKTVLCINHNLTELKKTEEALARSKDELEIKVKERTAQVLQERQRLFNVLETLPAMICLLTPDYHVAFANRSFREAFGESHGRRCYEYCFGRKEPCEFCESYRVLETGQPHHWEVNSPDGKVIDAFDFPFTDIDGSPMILEMDIDITVRKKAEAELKDLNDTLEQRVANRTAELETANKELEAFSYSISHDLRAPLRALDGFSEMLQEDYRDKLDETGKDYLDRISKASHTMSELIDAILKLSRISRAGMHQDRVNLSYIAKSIAEELKQSQPDRQAEFVIEPDLMVYGDMELLRVAFNNLLENAWKYSGKCTRTRIEFGKIEQSGEKVYFIKDNGVGFDMQYKDKLFQPFQRLHTSNEYPGTGIGLATVQRVIRRHNGRIWAESEIGKGTAFYLTLE